MQLRSNISYPPDITLLLRAYAEQRWLSAEVLPVLSELECPGAVADEQLGAALAYLEVLWMDARTRAAATEAALEGMLAEDPRRHSGLDDRAQTYHELVRAQRAAIGERVRQVTGGVSPFRTRDLHAAL
ncbi:MAG TPA: hypothetical protein VHT27_04940 [Solirubrobacteraceae bacterium]|jgi:hypothetical protein|nr:hypothetical protein [Solirubrobacteraceae bacterium]